MYPKSWRYYRDRSIYWVLFILLVVTAGYALAHPVYWILVLAIWMVRSPVQNAFYFAHPPRRFNWMPETKLDFREVTFPSRAGLTLFGRFAPGKNHAAILLLHGLGGANADMLSHAEILANAGYGVFLVDLRAHGSSDGDTSTFGLHEADDVAGAADYLLSRADVNGQKIGAIGISLGAQAALRGALKTDKLRALVLERLGPSVLSDHGSGFKSLQHWVNYPFNWLYHRVYEFMIGGRDQGVLEVIGRIAPRPVLFIASSRNDIYFSRLFCQAAGEPKELWELSNIRQGTAFLQDSQEYAKRVVGFFDKAL